MVVLQENQICIHLELAGYKKNRQYKTRLN